MRQASRYVPLVAIVVALFLALAVLPSSLNLPQSNPATTLEYAPVPPADDDVAPPGGNLSSLGLATSGTLGAAVSAAGQPAPAAAVPAGRGRNPASKRCVGTPLRQTDDPSSPPCVAHFAGDNFGATYPGVTRNEVRVLFFFGGGSTCSGCGAKGNDAYPVNKYFDLSQPPQDDDPMFVRMFRAWQHYFNDRYQTYDRFVHFYVYYSERAATVEARKAAAADNFNRVHPFAVVSYAQSGNEGAYLEAMAQKGVVNFGSFSGKEASFYQRFPKLIWGYPPSVQLQAKQFSSFVCRKVVPYFVSYSGNPADQGKPRKLGLLYPDNANFPGKKVFARLVRQQVMDCGGSFAAEATFSGMGYAINNVDPAWTTRATENMANFQSAGVTTIVWAQGYETEHTKAGAKLNYRPEWMIAGDGSLEGRNPSFYQDQTAFRHAWVMSNVTLDPPVAQSRCYRTAQEGDPNFSGADGTSTCNLYPIYNDLRQLFTGIQVAGPRLSPDSLDRGFHAIPAVASPDPTVPACYYDPGDYTCVKDAISMWWDPTGNTNGCWRVREGGRRFLADGWRSEDVVARKRTDDTCNGFGGLYYLAYGYGYV